MITPDKVLYCLLVGGPLDGTKTSEKKSAQKIVMNSDVQASGETRMGNWHIYKRCNPDVISQDGLTEFHFFTTSESPND